MALLELFNRIVWFLALTPVVLTIYTSTYSQVTEGNACISPERLQASLPNIVLSEKDRSLLQRLCVDEATLGRIHNDSDALQRRHYVHNGIPEGVECEEAQWCDDHGICTTVCKRGTVQLSPWYKWALDFQWQLARAQPFCLAQMLGSHNSAITMADGYGNRDKYFEEYFKYISWVLPDHDDTVHLSTNNQWLSLTDQMNMGIRAVELDVHWVQGDLRIAHCGGFHSPELNDLVDILGLLARVFNHTITWDAETIGCSPSLSSIPAKDQRTFLDSLQELAAWLRQPQHSDEFIVVFLDNLDDLLWWHKVPHLIADIKEAFPLEWVLTPADRAAMHGLAWPSINELVAMGKRVMIVSRSDYGDEGSSLLFYRNGNICGWLEFGLDSLRGPNECLVKRGATHVPSYAGRLLRLLSCELTYGPLNCDFKLEPAQFILDEESLGPVVQCGVNMPCPDRATPTRMEATIWSWAPGQPLPRNASLLGQPQCAVIDAQDGRWYTANCEEDHHHVCRMMAEPRPQPGKLPAWGICGGRHGLCPVGCLIDIPRHPKDNLALVKALQTARISTAWLPLTGPDFEPPVMAVRLDVGRVEEVVEMVEDRLGKPLQRPGLVKKWEDAAEAVVV